MKVSNNGERYRNQRFWNNLKNQPYDYENEGLLKNILPKKIIESKNKVLRPILNYYEQILIFLMKYVDELKHFKDYNWKNR